jgi:hypothetical protein
VSDRAGDEAVALAGGITLVVAGLFMVYALVQFHREATRPRRPRQVGRTRVLVMKTTEAPDRSVSVPARAAVTKIAEHQERCGNRDVSLATFPAGLRRLAVKRVGRS